MARNGYDSNNRTGGSNQWDGKQPSNSYQGGRQTNAGASGRSRQVRDNAGQSGYGRAYGKEQQRPGYSDQNGDRSFSRQQGGPSYGRKSSGSQPEGYRRQGQEQNQSSSYSKEGGYRRSGTAEGAPYRKSGGQGWKPRRKEQTYGQGTFQPGREEQAFTQESSRPRREEQPDRASSAPLQRPLAAPVQEDELPYIIMGRNAVREAIRSGRSIDRILVTNEPDGSLREILSFARDRNLQIREVDKRKLDEICMPFGHGNKPGNHQGILAQVPGVEYCDVADILQVAKDRGEPPFVILLDGIEDPHNLGSIIRSAECAGAHGVIIPKRRSASVTAAAAKASAGAVEYMKVARVSNLSNAIERLKQENVWIAGADMKGTPMAQCSLNGALGLVIGSEGEGLSRLVREKCDFLVSIPILGQVDSLNASVAAAVLMYAKRAMDAKDSFHAGS